MEASEVKAFEFKVEDGAVSFGVDSNKDGEKAISGKLNLGEAVQEAIEKGEAIEGLKVVDFKFGLTKLTFKIDTDRDGENVLEFSLDLGEVADEVKDLISKD